MPNSLTRLMGTTPGRLRAEIQEHQGRYMRLRRCIAAVALAGIASMSLTTLLQLGLVRRLPDPPFGGFDTKKVDSSDEAYGYGGPDSPINIVAHGMTLVLAGLGGADRARTDPWLPALAAAVELPQALVAAKYLFHQMPHVDKAWCPYCIFDALSHFVALGLILPEAAAALRHLATGPHHAA
jgi:uncharacterized membrane protein